MTLQPGNLQQTTSGGGNYTFSNLLPGSYTITPNLAAYAFTPPNRVVNLTNATVSGVNFSGASGAITLQAPANGTQFASLDPVTLQWVSNGTATKYTLEVSTSLTFTPLFKNVTVTGLTYSLTGLKSNTTYYWQVRQAAPTPVGAWSAPWSFTTPVPPAAPVQLTPANGAALPAGDFIPVFTWKAAVVPAGSAPVQHYHIQASQKSTFTSLDIDEYSLDASTTFTTLFNLTGNHTYYWHVRAFNTVGDYGPWSSVRTLKILPDKVASTWMTDANTLEPGFGWTDPQCIGKYLVQIYKGTAQVKSATVTTGTTCQGFYQLTSSLSLSTAYNWRVTVQGATGSSQAVANTFNSPAVVPGTPVLLGPANNEAIPDRDLHGLAAQLHLAAGYQRLAGWVRDSDRQPARFWQLHPDRSTNLRSNHDQLSTRGSPGLQYQRVLAACAPARKLAACGARCANWSPGRARRSI